MVKVEKITELANTFLADTPNYLVDVKVSRANKIIISIDNDGGGIKIDECVALSRFIEKNLDREKEDFDLEVSSHGIGQPLKLYRQYQKNTGRLVILTLTDGKKVEGTLTKATEDVLTISTEVKNKTTKKMETLVTDVPMANIKQTIVTFKLK